MTDSLIIRATCPFCRASIPSPFPKFRIAIANTHAKPGDPHGKRCRVIVVPASSAHAHEFYPVPEGQTIETVLQAVMEKLAA